MVGNGERINDGPFPGGNDSVPAQSRRRSGRGLDLGASPTATLSAHKPGEPGHLHEHVGPRRGVESHQANRRAGAYADVLGRFPTPVEINDRCTTGSFVARVDLMTTEEFLLVQRRRWAISSTTTAP